MTFRLAQYSIPPTSDGVDSYCPLNRHWISMSRLAIRMPTIQGNHEKTELGA